MKNNKYIKCIILLLTSILSFVFIKYKYSISIETLTFFFAIGSYITAFIFGVEDTNFLTSLGGLHSLGSYTKPTKNDELIMSNVLETEKNIKRQTNTQTNQIGTSLLFFILGTIYLTICLVYSL